MLKQMEFGKNFAKGVDKKMKMCYIMGEEPGARSQEPGARSQEPGARSQGLNFAFLPGHIHIDKSAFY